MIIKKFQITCLQTKDFVLFHLANNGSLKKKKNQTSEIKIVQCLYIYFQKEKIVIVQKNENKEIERYMAEGSSAYLNGLGKKAVASYQKALDLLSNKKAEVC